jgi:AraC-like DNA-binding protein
MVYRRDRLEKLVGFMARQAPEDGEHDTILDGLSVWRASTDRRREPTIDPPGVWLVGRGKRLCHTERARYDFAAGNVVVMCYPMAVETEIVEATPEAPFLMAGLALDLSRVADVLLRLEQIDGAAAQQEVADPSGIVSFPLQDALLEAFTRLLELLDDPRDVAMLGEARVNEVTYRLLTDERGGALRQLLQQRGEIQRLSRAVKHIHENLAEPVSVEALGDMVHMSRTAFYENFRDVMHLSPLQYAKAVKLNRARALIRAGTSAGEAGYAVGYNSPAQFSREYKRHFGYSPSATAVAG